MFITPEELDAQLEAILVDMEHDLDYHNLDADEYGEKYLELEDDEHGDHRFESDEYDGQPDEYTEWQDVYGGDDWDHGQYDEVF